MILDFDCNHTKINSIARSLEEIRNLDTNNWVGEIK